MILWEPPWRIHNVGVEWRSPSGMLALYVEGKNLDNAAIQDFAGYPLPGRSFFGTMRNCRGNAYIAPT